MLFVVTAQDKPGAKNVRADKRGEHLAYLADSSIVRLAGPFLDTQGNMVGSLVVLDVENLDAAQRWLANEPFAKAGLFESTAVKPWKATVNNCGAGL